MSEQMPNEGQDAGSEQDMTPTQEPAPENPSEPMPEAPAEGDTGSNEESSGSSES